MVLGATGKGKITVKFNEKVKDDADLILEGTGNEAGAVQWTCTGGSLDTKFRPSECRKASGSNTSS